MPDRFDLLGDADLEAALLDLGSALAVPAVTSAVGLDPARLARLRIIAGASAATTRPRRWSWLAPTGGRRLGRGVALALIAVIVVAAVAGAIGLGLPGIRIVIAPSASTAPPASPGSPTASPTATIRPTATPRPTIADPLGSNLGLGTQIALGEAEGAVDIPVILPAAPGIGAPSTAWLLEGRLAFAWRATPTLPETAEPGVGLLLGEFRGEIDPGYFQKILGEGTEMVTVSVDGVTGYWISGVPHEIVYVDANGNPRFDSWRSVGDTLLWARGDVTYRLESGLGRAATIAVAETMR
jgi:hypothetical protein